jgi:Flp pilus assembly protein TadG
MMRRIAFNERGAAIIELALIAPVLALGVIGIVDISNAFGRKLLLEQGAQRAIEKIMQTTQDETVDDTVKKEAVCQVNGANPDGTCKAGIISTSDVTVTYRLECTAGGTTTVYTGVAAATDCASNEKQAQYVSVTVSGTYTPMFSTHFASFNNSDGKYHLSATAGMRTQ